MISALSAHAPTVTVYIVTYRRHEMLRRAISSVLAQTFRDLKLLVVNDDPSDDVVADIVKSFADDRAAIFRPVQKRGATRNFNLVFEERDSPYSALLEDDNWWDSTFLERQMALLEAHPEMPIVVGNERIWKELPGGAWMDTCETIWPFRDIRFHEASLEWLCGHAVLCNSSMLVRTSMAGPLVTPISIPVDVTEHFRERLMPRRLLLNGELLVNYAETIETARGKGALWGQFQTALIASVFLALPDERVRRRLAESLWRGVPSATSPRATSLVSTGISIAEARSLVSRAPIMALVRTVVSYVRRPSRLLTIMRTRRAMMEHIEFLATTPLVRELAREAS